MSFDKISELADNFMIKIAEQHYADNAPRNVKAKNLTWLDEDEINLIKQNGKNMKYLPHNPPSSIVSEKIWDKAKKVVKKYWDKYDEPWAVVFDVYYSMGGKLKKKK